MRNDLVLKAIFNLLRRYIEREMKLRSRRGIEVVWGLGFRVPQGGAGGTNDNNDNEPSAFVPSLELEDPKELDFSDYRSAGCGYLSE